MPCEPCWERRSAADDWDVLPGLPPETTAAGVGTQGWTMLGSGLVFNDRQLEAIEVVSGPILPPRREQVAP